MSNSVEVQPEVMAAEEEVRRAREALVTELQAVSASGKRAISRAVQKSRPLIVGACVVGGVAILIGVTKLVRHRRRPIFSLTPPPSLPSIVVRAALSTLARTLAVRVAERLSVHVGEAALRLPNPRLSGAEPTPATAPPPAPAPPTAPPREHA